MRIPQVSTIKSGIEAAAKLVGGKATKAATAVGGFAQKGVGELKQLGSDVLELSRKAPVQIATIAGVSAVGAGAIALGAEKGVEAIKDR